jgi:hypothetical protein
MNIMEEIPEQLHRQLAAWHDEVSQRCLHLIERNSPETELVATRPLPFEEVNRIYTKRAAINQYRNLGVAGYDSLVKSLDITKSTSVVIFAITCDSVNYSLLFGLEEQDLIGVIEWNTD